MSCCQEDDFDYICNLAAGCPQERVVDTALPALTDKDSAPQAGGDFTTVCDVLGSLPKRSFEQRSWQLAERMRNAKRQKKDDRDKEADARRRDDMKYMLAAVSASSKDSIPKHMQATLNPEQGAIVAVHIACRPAARGKGVNKARVLQHKECMAIASYGEHAQKTCHARIIQKTPQPHPMSHSCDGVAPVPGPPSAVGDTTPSALCYQCSFDTTTQWLREPRPAGDTKHANNSSIAVHVLMQMGRLRVIKDGSFVEEDEPHICKSCILEETNTDFMLEGFLTKCPLPLTDGPAMSVVSVTHRTIHFQLCLDRHIVNYGVAKWLAHMLHNVYCIRNILFHLEPCNAHGGCLSKLRSPRGRATACGLNTFSRLTRDWRARAGIGKCIDRLVVGVSYRNSNRPQEHIDWAEKMVAAILGEDLQYLVRKLKNGSEKESSVLVEMRDLFEVVDVQLVDIDGVATYEVCGWVVWKSCLPALARETNGHWHCDDPGPPSQSLLDNFVRYRVHRWAIGRTWATACISRWTHVSKLRKRYAACIVANNVLGDAILDYQGDLQLDQSLEKQLEAVIAQDSGDFHAKRHLKVLRVTRLLCKSTTKHEMAIILCGENLVDEVFWSILGCRNRERINLFDLVDPTTSPISRVDADLFDMLDDFSRSNPKWAMYASTGGSFLSVESRSVARTHLVRLSTGMDFYFCDRLGKLPYSLLRPYGLAGPKKGTVEFQSAGIDELFSSPWECLSSMLRNLRKLYPSKCSFKEDAMQDLLDWSHTTELAMDFVERSHNHLREALKTSTSGRDLGPPAAQIFCKQAAAIHHARGGKFIGGEETPLDEISRFANLAVDGRPLALQTTSDVSKSSHEGSVFIRFRSLRLRAYKQQVAPCRPLSRTESEEFEARISRDWRRIQGNPEELQKYALWNKASKLGVSTPRQEEREPAVAASADFKNVWSDGKERGLLFDPVLLSQYRSEHAPTRDDQCTIKGAVPDRFALLPDDCNVLVNGCCSNKRSLCRKHVLAAEVCRSLTTMEEMLYKWVDQQPSAVRDNMEAFVLFRDILWHSIPKDDPDVKHDLECCDNIVLVSDYYLKPKIQSLMPMRLEDNMEAGYFFEVPAVPFRIKAVAVQSKLSDRLTRVPNFSSGRYLHDLCTMRSPSEWSLHALTCVDTVHSPSLLAWTCIEIQEAFEVLRRRRRPAGLKSSIDVLNLGDPLAVGSSDDVQNPTDPGTALGGTGSSGTSGANLPDAGENGFCVDRGEVVGDLGPAAGAALFELASQPSSESEDGDGDEDIWMGRLPVFIVSSYSAPRPPGKRVAPQWRFTRKIFFQICIQIRPANLSMPPDKSLLPS